MFDSKALTPLAVLLLPVAPLDSTKWDPPKSAQSPSAVLFWGYPPSGAGVTASTSCESANKSASARRAAGTRRHKGDRLIELRACRVAVLKGFGRFIGSFFLFGRSMCANVR